MSECACLSSLAQTIDLRGSEPHVRDLTFLLESAKILHHCPLVQLRAMCDLSDRHAERGDLKDGEKHIRRLFGELGSHHAIHSGYPFVLR